MGISSLQNTSLTDVVSDIDKNIEDISNNEARITANEEKLNNNQASVPYSVLRGQNIIDSTQDSGVLLKGIKGRTDINHVPLFDIWTLASAGITRDSDTKISIVADGTVSRTAYVEINSLKPSTQYTLTWKGATETSGVYVDILEYDSSGTMISDGANSISGQLTFTTQSTTAKAQVRCAVTNAVASGTYTFENIMLAEGSEARPFVANMKPLGAVLIENKGKNLLKTKPDNIDLSGSVVQNDQYDLTLNATGTGQGMTFLVPAMPNQQYYFRIAEHGARTYIISIDKDGTETFLQTTTPTTQYSVIAPSNSVTLKVGFTSGTVGAGTYNFKNYILSLEDTPFEPQTLSRIVIPKVGHSSADGTVYDEVYERDGKLWRLQKFGYKVLDGSLNWSIQQDFSGYKRVTLMLPNAAANQYPISVKFNGAILTWGSGDWGSPDQVNINHESRLFLTISDTDSGWQESIMPNVDMIKGYFNGWVLSPDSTTFYSMYDESVTASGYDEIASRNLHAENGKVGYQIQYQLAQPVEVEIADIGGLALHGGLNQVELSEGIILGEPNIPAYSTFTDRYYLNSYEPYSPLKRRASAIKVIYKNGKDDTHNWIIRTRSDMNSEAYKNAGVQFAEITASDYDPTAAYSVDYIALDKYLLTTNATEAELEGQANLATAVDKNVRDIADIKRDVTVIERDYARKQQMKLITPTALNGTTISGGYYKDEFGIVHFMGTISGLGNLTDGSVFAKMPQGFKPMNIASFVLVGAGFTTTVFVRVNANGELAMMKRNGTDSSAYLNTIIYRAVT